MKKFFVFFIISICLTFTVIASNQLVCLENLPIIEWDRYTGNLGDSCLFSLDRDSLPGIDNDYYGNGNIGVDGTIYANGFEAWIARWNPWEEISWVWATFDLERKYSKLYGRTGLIESYNTTNFDTTLYFYSGEDLLYSVRMTPGFYDDYFEIDVSGVCELKILIKDNVANKGGTSFAIYDLFLEPINIPQNSEVTASLDVEIEVGEEINLYNYAFKNGITSIKGDNPKFSGTTLDELHQEALGRMKGIEWSSSNSDIVCVDENGVAIGSKDNVGFATISASKDGYMVLFNVVVNYPAEWHDYTFGFINDYDKFGYDKTYSIPPVRYKQAGVAPFLTVPSTFLNWSGSCFGMSVASILLYKDVIDLETLGYDDSVTPNKIQSANTDSETDKELRELIEYLQIKSLCFPSKDSFSFSEVKKQLDSDNPIVLNLKAPNPDKPNSIFKVRHSIVIYDYIGSNFYVYDPSGFVSQIKDNNGNAKFEYNDATYKWSINDVVYYDSLIDTVFSWNDMYFELKYNAKNPNIAFLSSETEWSYISTFCSNLDIISSNNETHSIVNGDLDNNNESFDIVYPELLSDSAYVLRAPNDTYTIINRDTSENSLYLTNGIIGVETNLKTNIPTTFSSNLLNISYNFSENENDFSITYFTPNNALFDEITLTGVAGNSLSINYDGVSRIEVVGAKSLSASASVSENSVYTQECDVSEYDKVMVYVDKDENGYSYISLSTNNADITEKQSLSARQQVEVPTYNLESGEYTEGQLLTFNIDNDTIVYYTTDGTIPTKENGIIYSSSITINKSVTVKAIATKFGYADSDVVELTYVLPEIAEPIVNIKSGTYNDIMYITLKHDDEDADLFYSFDGNNAFMNKIYYMSPICILQDSTIYVYAVKDGVVSDIVKYEYKIQPKASLFIFNTPTNQDGDTISLDSIDNTKSIKFAVKRLDDKVKNALFYIVFYDEKGKVTNIKTQKQDFTQTDNFFNISVDEIDSAAKQFKVFMMDSSLQIVPLAENYNYSIPTYIDYDYSKKCWSFDLNTEDWNVSRIDATVSNGFLNGTVTDLDPIIYNENLSFNADDYKYLVVDMELSSTNSFASDSIEVFWGTGWNDLSEDKRVSIVHGGTTNGIMHRFVFDLSSNENWTGDISFLRIDPSGNTKAVFSIDSIILTNSSSYIEETQKYFWGFDNKYLPIWRISNASGELVDGNFNICVTESSLTSSGIYDPIMKSTFEFSADDYRYVIIKAKIETDNHYNNDSVQFFFKPKGVNWSEAYMVRSYHDGSTNGEYRTFVFDMSENEYWTGEIEAIRLDPFNSVTGTASISEIKLTNDADIYSVAFDFDGGSYISGTKNYYSFATQFALIGEQLVLTKATPQKDGFTFKGWSDSPNGVVIHMPGDCIAYNENTILYAVWEKEI